MTSKIYIIRNDINDKVYIGKTTLPTIDARFKEHCKDAFRERNEKRPLYSAMRKYGIEHFTISLIEECQVKDDCEREIYWIQQYNSYKNGYNATFGGDGKHYLDYEEIASSIKENPDRVVIDDCGQIVLIADITKHSFNLIDLIEVRRLREWKISSSSRL